MQAGAAADPARDVAIAAPRALAAAEPVLAWADALVAVAEAVAGATSAAEAARLVPDLPPLARQLTRGVDRDGDERITFAPGEAGLIGLRLALGALVAHRDALAAAGIEVPR